MRTLHAYDRLLAVRTLLASLLLVLLAIGIVVATDEPLSTLQMRVARLSALAPAIVAIAIFVVLGQARARGELRALAALGEAPLRLGLGALCSGWAIGALTTLLLLSPLADVSALFPAVSTPAEWRFEAGRMIAPASGVSVAADGALELGLASAGDAGGAVSLHALSAALAVGPLGVAAPLWAVTSSAWHWRALAAAGSLALVLVLLHAVAAGRVPSVVLVLAALPLVMELLSGHFRRGRA